MKSTHKYQRGAALIALLAVLALGTSWFLVSRLNAASGDFTAASRNHNAKVLNQAKQALIGYVAMKAAQAGERNPGRLECPEANGYIGSPNDEGRAAGNCTLPKIGRLPWRTLGLDKLVDSAGEPLWYVVSTGWALPSATGSTLINSNSVGQLTVDGQANGTVVALIIAPGPAMNVAAVPLQCTARNQSRSAPAPGMDPLDYLECFNTATSQFSTTGPSTSFNDQVVQITVADLMPAIEAAIASRIEREIVPQLKLVYADALWGLTAANPLYPFPAPFANPGPGPGSSAYQGAAGTYWGLLPFNYSNGCNPATDPRCTTTFVNWDASVGATPTVTATGGTVVSQTCSATATTATCSGIYRGSLGANVQLRMTATALNAAMALRQFDKTQTTVQYGLITPNVSVTPSVSGAFNSSGSARIFTDGTAPGFSPTPLSPVDVQFQITANIGVLADHWLLSTADPPPMNTAGCPATTPTSPNVYCTGWFMRNQWYRLTYYAVAQGHTATVMPAVPACTTSTNCITVANITPTAAQRAILILAGRSINGSARPSGALANYLEFGNATATGTAAAPFERQPVSTAIAPALKKPFNDRIVVVDSNP